MSQLAQMASDKLRCLWAVKSERRSHGHMCDIACESALFCDGCCCGRTPCGHRAVAQRAISAVSDVYFCELIEFIVLQFWGS